MRHHKATLSGSVPLNSHLCACLGLWESGGSGSDRQGSVVVPNGLRQERLNDLHMYYLGVNSFCQGQMVFGRGLPDQLNKYGMILPCIKLFDQCQAMIDQFSRSSPLECDYL